MLPSAMNQRQKPNEEENPLRVGERYFDENFGMLEIDWTGKESIYTSQYPKSLWRGHP